VEVICSNYGIYGYFYYLEKNMIIMVIAYDIGCWDDGCKTVLVGNCLEDVIKEAREINNEIR
jgi:hypothetical protein